MVQVQNRELAHRHVQSVMERASVYTQQSLFGQVQNVQTCPVCRGTGKVIKEKCPDCYGSGYVTKKKKVPITIPAGVDNGTTLRKSGLGEPGTNGGERGDLLIEIIVFCASDFQASGDHIYSTVPISFATAALGGTIKIRRL